MSFVKGSTNVSFQECLLNFEQTIKKLLGLSWLKPNQTNIKI